ncbi:MAG: amidase [Ardenticatenaceae bacterium]|nr:amidase [Ardenticatenaceae bacterium]
MAVYDLESVKLPRLAGRPLRAFAAALDNPATRTLLLGNLLESGGITRLRQFHLSELPLLYPLAAVAERGGALEKEAWAETAVPAPTNTPFATIGDYAQAYRNGRTTPLAVAEKLLEAIAASEQGDKPLRAFIAINRQDVLAQAQAASERIQNGQALSALDGVPVAVKDEVDMTPYPTTVGTKFLGKAPAEADATTVARLRAAGALLIGKANMHEIGINPTGHNVYHGHTRNPYHPDFDTGGSSSGPATAVAAGFCPVSLGADGGGSIRVPAALCGLVGLKATFGRISEFGAAPLTWSMGHLGPIGATVADVALAYAIMAGPDERDLNSQQQPAVTLADWDAPDLRGLTLGVYWPWFRHATPEIVAANEAMLNKLADAGAAIREITIPKLDAMRIAHAVTILAEMATNMAHYPQHQGDFAPATRVSLVLGRAFTSADYLRAQQVRRQAMAIFAEVYRQVDVVMTPATAVTAPPIPADGLPDGLSDLSTVTELMRYVIPGNLIGLPAISFPVGYGANGLPIAMQAMGRHWQENVLLRVAHVAEKLVERKRPQVFYQVLDK